MNWIVGKKPGDVTDVPDLYLARRQDRRIHPVMYIARIILRVKNLTLGFTLPDQWLTKLGVSKARLYFSGSNLFDVGKVGPV